MQLPATVNDSANRIADGAAILVLGAVALIALLTFKDYGLGWDDYTHSQYGQMLLDFYASGFSDRRALSFVNLHMYGGGFDMAAALLDKMLPSDLFETRRLAGALVGIVGLLAVWLLARRLGGPRAGLIALALLATCPLYYGHMFINAKDAPFAVAMAVLLLGLARALDEYPRPGVTTLLIFGLGLGFSIGSRILGGLAALDVALPMAMILVSDLRHHGAWPMASRFGRFVLVLLPAIVLGYLVMGLIWPWSVLDPLNPIRAIGYFSEFFEKPWKEMFGGALMAVPDMPRSYVPVYFALQLPEILIALALSGLAGALAAATRSSIPIGRRASLLLVAIAATLPILIAVATRPAMYNGVRHFIFVIPPLCVLGGLAGGYILERLWRVARPAAAIAGLAMLAALALPVTDMVRLHPYQYVHFSRSAGGIRAADERYMLDYWGLSFKQAARYLRTTLAERHEKPVGRPWRIAICGPHPPAEVELGNDFFATWDPKDADFALMLGEFYCAELDAPVLVEIKREGVAFARAYDIRGRTITDLFTIPPVTR